MKLTTAQIKSFLQKPDPMVVIVLLYGSDAGLVRERADALARIIVPDLKDPFRVTVLSGAVLIEDPARLGDEMAAQALGGGRRLIRIQHANEPVAGALASFLKNAPPTDSLLIIEGGDLDKRSKLRALCENDARTAVIACYVEDGVARQRSVTDILQAEGLHISRDALALLCDILPPDRIAMRSELEKLAMYMSRAVAIAPHAGREQPRQIKIEDVQAIIQDAGVAELDDLIFAVGGGDARRVAVLIDHLLDEQTSPVAILRAAQRHFMRLQWARYQMSRGASPLEAVKKLQPPVFWKHADAMAAQLHRWSAAKIEKALTRLFEAEAAIKRTGTPDTALCAQVLLGMAA